MTCNLSPYRIPSQSGKFYFSPVRKLEKNSSNHGKVREFWLAQNLKVVRQTLVFCCISKQRNPLDKHMWNWKWVEIIVMELWDFIRKKSGNFDFLKCREPCFITPFTYYAKKACFIQNSIIYITEYKSELKDADTMCLLLTGRKAISW